MTETNEHDWLAPLVAAFVRNLPLRAAALRSVEKQSNVKEIASLAHQMAGAVVGYGLAVATCVHQQRTRCSDKADRQVHSYGATRINDDRSDEHRQAELRAA